jgi:hypothetical protein
MLRSARPIRYGAVAVAVTGAPSSSSAIAVTGAVDARAAQTVLADASGARLAATASSQPSPATRTAQSDAGTVRDLLNRYATQVTDDEWPALTDGRGAPEVGGTIGRLRTALTALPVDAEIVAEARKQALQDLRQIDESRRARVDMAASTDAFTIALLIGTVFGAVLVIAFPLIFGLSRRPADIVVMALLAVTLGATMYVSWQLMHPLEGFFGATPEAFRSALDEMAAATNT